MKSHRFFTFYKANSLVGFFILLSLLFTGNACNNSTKQGFSITEKDSVIVDITCLNERTINVRAYPKLQKQKESLVVNNKYFPFSDYKIVKEAGKTILTTAALKVVYNHQQETVTFYDFKTGKEILKEKTRNFVPVEILGDNAYNVSQQFSLSPQEAVYGLGQYQQGLLNYRGNKVNLVHANREIANPVLLSTNNYLIYWDNYSKTIFEDNENGAQLWSEVGDAVNYYFVYGKDMSEALSGFRDLTGHAPMLPKSAFGFWMSKERYRSFAELLSVVKEYRNRKIPLDNIVQDWQYWGSDLALWNSMKFDTQNFANPKEVIDSLHNLYNVKLTLSVWPAVGTKTDIYETMDSAKVLFNVPTWAGYKVIDIYNPKAQEIYWDYLYKGLYTKGVDSWWMDATEPSFKDGLYQERQEYWSKEAGMTYLGTFARYLNTYSLVFSEMMYNNLRKQSNKRVSILTRSAFAGQQKYSTSTWSGDIYASWDVLKKQIPAGLNLCMTGIPYWTTDIGGFRVKSSDRNSNQGQGEISTYVNTSAANNDGGYTKGLADSAYLELYTRWFQYGAFNPMFRAHGTEVPREIWQFGEPGSVFYDVQLKMINLRYSLMSYIYSNSWEVSFKGKTMMRALVMDFTNDKNVYDIANGYMFCKDILVYPVITPMYYNREGKIKELNTNVALYLPEHAGKYWYDMNYDKYYAAGQNISYNAPLNIIPLFAKGGAIIPRNQPVEYVAADDNKKMDIVVYTGNNATFELYEDDNETYNYENGEYSVIKISWDENKKELLFSSPTGNMKPKHKERMFNIAIITPNQDGTVNKFFKEITYNNSEYIFKL